jgi:hypothetical protein
METWRLLSGLCSCEWRRNKLHHTLLILGRRRRSELGSGLHPLTGQKVIFDMFCDQAEFQVESKDLATVWNLKKPSQRSRKCHERLSTQPLCACTEGG